MSIWGLLIVWLGGWALIILLHTIAIALFSRQTNAKIWEDEGETNGQAK